MDWKMSLETLKNSQNVISLSIYCPIKRSSILHLSFYWKCPLHPYWHSKWSLSSSSIMADMCFSISTL